MERKWMAILALVALGCDDGATPADAGVDAGGAETIQLAGLDGAVEVIIDDRGMPHIYASTEHDALVVQGYLMARDRFIQMEFIRRGVTGRVTEVLAGAISDPDDREAAIQDDLGARFLGFGRTGQEIYDSLAADDPTRLVAEAFVEGINLYIHEVVMAPGYQPPEGLEVFNFVRLNDNFGDWSAADIFALARYQAYNLSYDAGADIDRTRTLAGVQAAFPGDSRDDFILPRAGIFADLYSERQARPVYTRMGFNDGTTTALNPGPVTRPRIVREAPLADLASIALLDRGARFFERLDHNPLFTRDPHIGSNSWVVSGTLTESGNPILSNDPHLDLISPGVWWYVHLNTERMGGDMDAQGVAFAGLPGVVLGYNRDLAWSATTTGYDVTDVYQEVVTFAGGAPTTVTFEGAEVALETITETVRVSGEADRTLTIYVAPHHGPLIPDTIMPPAAGDGVGSAMSVKYTGHVPTNELAFFTGLLRATGVDEALTAQDNFRVGAQNFSYATRSGDIAWSTESRIPQREPEACSFAINADGTIGGISPLFVLPGDGTAEWTTDLDEAFIPHDRNPAQGYVATANQDNVGVTDDGNPCNDGYYIGGGFDVGYRQARIVQRLEAARAAETGITPDDMITLQAETESSLGNGMRDALVASLDRALGTPTDPALMAALTEAGADGLTDLATVRDRLMAWSYATPHGIDATGTELDDSVATTIFNVAVSRLGPLAFGDESTRIGRNPPTAYAARMLEWALLGPTEQQALPLYTFRANYPTDRDPWNDTVLWDDIDTDTVLETRDERVVRAVLAAVLFLETELGTDWNEWRWGRLHAVRFEQIVPAVTEELVSIPPGNSTELPIGFPRHGDYGAVDVGNFGLWNSTRFTHGSGASQRLVVEMTDDGPSAFNALPGGQSEDIASAHHDDEAELWRRNQQPPLYFERADVEAHAESTILFQP